jgi:hypothetical protein
MGKSELKKELQTRGLSISGGREQLIHRLHLADAPAPPSPSAALPAAVDSTTETEPVPAAVISETEVKEEEKTEEEPVKKTRAVRKKKTATTPVLASSSSTDLEQQQQLSETALLKLAKGELQAMAATHGVAKSGTKAQIVARILEVENSGEVEPAAEAGEETFATAVAEAVEAPKKKRVVVKKKTPIVAKEMEITTTETEKEESTPISTSTIQPFTPRSPLRLSEAAALKRDTALAAAVTVTAALNSKRRVLAMMEEVISVAMTTSAAQNLKWQQEEQHAEKDKKEEEEKIQKINAAEEEEKLATSSEPSPSPVTVSERRKLSPQEAAKVLEEVVRRKGTGGVGLGTGDGGDGGDGSNSGSNSGRGNGNSGFAEVVVAGVQKQVEVASEEVDSMKTVMAGLKDRLSTQEENTEQLRASIQKTEAPSAAAVAAAAVAAVVVQEEQKIIEKTVVDEEKQKKEMVYTLNTQETTAPAITKAPTTAATPVVIGENMQALIDFTLTLGKAVSVVGREVFKSMMKKK